ncbi:hypothetical protein P8625_09715 [Tenacibaculum tangerinum]|uniref:Uncharacterized protein n=1 Tax=Tenacibaculum tangerinum TaxID=3038772 RepID=A0ABY8L170_9FLAO|nr:hypothetical protein [Tenacibaculum tangerinum]WGH74387.1 hypothetical protein P8625_09715 [Tenacibaculum tangerinum]
MKTVITCILLLFSYSINSQSLSKRQIYKLNALNVKTNELNLNNLNIQKDLNEILILEKKRKTNKTVAIVLSSIAVSGILLGGALYSQDDGLSEVFGATFMVGGAVYGGISIPFWTSSKKRKKERDKLLQLFND